MKKLKLLIVPLLIILGMTMSYGQDVEIPFSWVSPTPSSLNMTGISDCGGMNITLNSYPVNHQLDGTSAFFPDGMPTTIPVTISFSKPVCNLGLLVRDLDWHPIVGEREWLEFDATSIPTGLDPSAGGPPFSLVEIGGTWTALPLVADESEAWINWDGPITAISFDYFKATTGFYFYLDSLRFDCDCSIPDNLDCCYANDRQSLSWSKVPSAVGYEIEFGFNDNSSGCCDSVTGPPMGWIESVSDNVFIVPETFTNCFWWRVRSVFDDGSKSEWSEKSCDCDEPEVLSCEAPINLMCEMNSAGQKIISWDPVIGAIGYEVSRTYNDPTCCPPTTDPIETIATNTTSTFIVDPNPNDCYSWKVRAICSDEPLYSDWSETKCTEDCAFSALLVGSGKDDSDEQSTQSSSSKLTLNLTPNPAKDILEVTLSGPNTESELEEGMFSMHNAQGNEVHRELIRINRSTRIDLDGLSSGIYICTYIGENGASMTGKLVIE